MVIPASISKKSSRLHIVTAFQTVCVAALLALTSAHADEYDDVNALVRAGRLAEALAKADQYLAGKPRGPQMRFIKGVIQTEAGKPADAIATFTQITQDYPELPEPYNNLAVLYANQSQFDKARAALEMAIRTNPSYATAHENLGDVYAKLASQAYSKALQLDGGNAGVQPKLALIRTLFAPDAKGQRPSAGAQPSGTAGPTATKVPPVPAVPPPAVVATPPAAGRAPATAAAPTPAPAAAPVAAPTPAPAAAPAAAPTPAPAASPAARSGAEKEIESVIRNWAAAWSAKDMASYLGSYGKEFDPPGSVDRKTWEEDRSRRIMGKSRISVKLSDLTVTVKGSKASAKFKQVYSADALNVSSRKTLDLLKAGDRWVIVRESTG